MRAERVVSVPGSFPRWRPVIAQLPKRQRLSLSALFTNTSRAAAFWRLVDRRRALIVLVAALPTCVLGAWGYTLLTGKGAALVIGAMLVASVPLRRLMRRRGLALSSRGLAAASFGWGPLAGGTVGAGIILLSLLMAAGLEGAAVVATDAVISIGIGLAKFATFGLAGVVNAQVIAIALFIGNIVTIVLLNYLVPWTSMRFSWWLVPKRPYARRLHVAGLVLLTTIYGLMLVAFLWLR